jgi:hypothetical protein
MPQVLRVAGYAHSFGVAPLPVPDFRHVFPVPASTIISSIPGLSLQQIYTDFFRLELIIKKNNQEIVQDLPLSPLRVLTE